MYFKINVKALVCHNLETPLLVFMHQENTLSVVHFVVYSLHTCTELVCTRVQAHGCSLARIILSPCKIRLSFVRTLVIVCVDMVVCVKTRLCLVEGMRTQVCGRTLVVCVNVLCVRT